MMIQATCDHSSHQRYGKTRKGEQRYKCNLCGAVWFDAQPKPLGEIRIDVAEAKLALRMLVEGSSVRSTARITGLDKATLLKLIVLFGDKCRAFLDSRMRGLTLGHLQFDEQWTYVKEEASPAHHA